MNALERLPTNYLLIKDLEILSAEDLLAIELAAKVLEFEEALQSIFLEAADLSDKEVALAKRVWRRGRFQGIQEAGTKLFKQMENRNGTQACIDYLRQMSGTFSLEVTPVSTGSGFSFNVFPPAEAKPDPDVKTSPIKEVI